MRVLVTGGAGFIGSNLVWMLVGAGHDVSVIDDFSAGSPSNLHPAASFRMLDILDPALPALMCDFKPESVVHLAAQSSVSASMVDPERDHRVNAIGTQLVAEAAVAAGARRVLSASSAAVYGEPVELPLTETSPKAPANPYGASKLEAEGLLAKTLAGTGVDYASLRFSNVYGPRQNAEGEGGVVAIFSGAIAAGRVPVMFGDGSQTRDFIYVGDVAGAIFAALQRKEPLAGDGPDGPAYNISTGRETSLMALVLSLRAASGYFGKVEQAPARAGDILSSVLDPTKAQDTLRWQACAELDQGLETTWHWFSQNR